MPIKRKHSTKRATYWWTDEIAVLRRRCNKLRRAAQRSTNRPEANEKSAEHKAAKKLLRKAITQRKIECWKSVCEDANSDPWGMAYKITMKRLGVPKNSNCLNKDAMKKIVDSLFQTHPPREHQNSKKFAETPLFTIEELERHIVNLPKRKAPGPDGIPNEILTLVYKSHPNLLLDLYNACLQQGVFPHRWKMARLVLIRKGTGSPTTPSSYRPLCMLDTTGKLIEKLIRTRLHSAVEAAGGLSPRQYGFRKGCSTADAISEIVKTVERAESYNHYSRRVVLLVTLDVRNAFNTVRWSDIVEAIEHTFQAPPYLVKIIEVI